MGQSLSCFEHQRPVSSHQHHLQQRLSPSSESNQNESAVVESDLRKRPIIPNSNLSVPQAAMHKPHVDVLDQHYSQPVLGDVELECIICFDTFSEENPKIRTLCECGMNRTNFHLSCLYEWMEREHNCPLCRSHLFFEED